MISLCAGPFIYGAIFNEWGRANFAALTWRYAEPGSRVFLLRAHWFGRTWEWRKNGWPKALAVVPGHGHRVICSCHHPFRWAAWRLLDPWISGRVRLRVGRWVLSR